jgi:hypothetical protein
MDFPRTRLRAPRNYPVHDIRFATPGHVEKACWPEQLDNAPSDELICP